MTRRIGLACAYTLFVFALLSTWPSSRIGDMTVITTMPMARWLVMPIPLYWAWAAFGLENKWARRTSVAAAAILLVACFIFIVDQDSRYGGDCLWNGPGCNTWRWFN
jgi:hypothetical protein